jgi:hypothetical protein
MVVSRQGFEVETLKYRVLVENFTNQISLLMFKPFVGTRGNLLMLSSIFPQDSFRGRI